ncbi:POK9 protein, partial [Nothocercus julius]|nr:POK9 protein [Nothocercus julius]
LAQTFAAMRGSAEQGRCFSCGKEGHFKKNCPRKQKGSRAPGVCPRCQKGRHYASQCRSEIDKDGRPLQNSGNRNCSVPGNHAMTQMRPDCPAAMQASSQPAPQV